MAKPSPLIDLVAEYMTGEVSDTAFRSLAAAIADASKDAPQLTTLEQAQQLLLTAPANVSVQELATKIGVTRQALYKYPGFRAAWKAFKAARRKDSRIRRGSKSKEGSLEAIDDNS